MTPEEHEHLRQMDDDAAGRQLCLEAILVIRSINREIGNVIPTMRLLSHNVHAESTSSVFSELQELAHVRTAVVAAVKAMIQLCASLSRLTEVSETCIDKTECLDVPEDLTLEDCVARSSEIDEWSKDRFGGLD